MKTIQSLVNEKGSEVYFRDWILSNLPKSYSKMTYIEPHFKGGVIFLHKRLGPENYINIDNPLLNAYIRKLIESPKEVKNFILSHPFWIKASKELYQENWKRGVAINKLVRHIISHESNERIPLSSNSLENFCNDIPRIYRRLNDKRVTVCYGDNINFVERYAKKSNAFFYMHFVTSEDRLEINTHKGISDIMKKTKGKFMFHYDTDSILEPLEKCYAKFKRLYKLTPDSNHSIIWKNY